MPTRLRNPQELWAECFRPSDLLLDATCTNVLLRRANADALVLLAAFLQAKNVRLVLANSALGSFDETRECLDPVLHWAKLGLNSSLLQTVSQCGIRQVVFSHCIHRNLLIYFYESGKFSKKKKTNCFQHVFFCLKIRSKSQIVLRYH